jgi:hypothetical protein
VIEGQGHVTRHGSAEPRIYRAEPYRTAA